MVSLQTNPKALFLTWQDIERWDFLSAWLHTRFHTSHPLVPLSDIAKVRQTIVSETQLNDGEVSMVDKVSFEGEIFAGDKEQTKMTQYLALPGDLIVSKIRARQGSIGLVDDTSGKVSVSIHYRVLTLDSSKVDRKYAWLALRSSYCRTQFLAATGGAMKGEISEAALLSIKVPLPALQYQKAIVARWQKSQQDIEAAKELVERARTQIDVRFFHALGLKPPILKEHPKVFAVWWKEFLRWSVSYNQAAQASTDITQGRFPVVQLASVLELVQYGTSEKANARGEGIPILRINNIKDGVIDPSELKHIKLPQEASQNLLLQDGDILIIRTSGSRNLVGTCAVFHEDGEYIFASYLIRLRPDQSKADPDFIAWFLNSALGRQQIDAVSRQIMMNNINSEELRSLQIPLPPLDVQRSIVQQIMSGKAEIMRERAATERMSHEAEADVEALILGTKKLEGELGSVSRRSIRSAPSRQ